MSTSQAPVLIIGAGITGLALGQGLEKLNIDFKVFERDATTDDRSQGYRIRIHNGVPAIKNTVPAQVAELIESTSAQFEMGKFVRMSAITGEVAPSPVGDGPRQQRKLGPGNPWTLDRRVFRDALMAGIKEKVIFGKTFHHFDVDGTGVTAFFTDGSSERGCFLVGADGKNSVVGKQHNPDHTLIDTQGCMFFGKTPLNPETEGKFTQFNGHGMQVFEDRQSLATPLIMLAEDIRWSQKTRSSVKAVQLPEDYIYWVVVTQRGSLPYSSNTLAELKLSDKSRAADAVLHLTKDWHPDLCSILANQIVQATSFLQVHSSSPDLEAWKPSRFVTILGDAAHAMPPTAAGGANAALVDVEKLVKLLSEIGIEGLTDEAVCQFESEMREAAAAGITQSFGAGAHAFGQKSLEECLALARQ